ncbi:hypothetical protein, partial [Microbispora rosea]
MTASSAFPAPPFHLRLIEDARPVLDRYGLLLAGSGFAGVNFAYIEDSAKYHTAGDSIANLDH